MAPQVGFEPTLSDSESEVLPLDYWGMAAQAGVEPATLRSTGAFYSYEACH